MMAVALSIVIVDPAEIVAVDVSDVETCTVTSSVAPAWSNGAMISHKTTNSPTKPLFSRKDLMLGHTLSKMFDNPIISFYVTKKGASTWLTPLIVGLIKP
jgi:hypothetical protein